MSKHVGVVLCAIAALGASMTPASAQMRKDNWDNLGCVDVGRGIDRHIINVGKKEGRYKAIRLSALNNDVNVIDLRVVYGNGAPDDIPVRSEIREGTDTRPLDLQGRERAIARVEIVTKSGYKGRRNRQARLCAAGLQDDRRGPGFQYGGKWELLGCQKVGFLVDRDVINVGRREGRFKAVRIEVSENSVYMNDLRVVYANGEPDNIPVRAEIRAGGQSGPLDLKGRERAISRIELVYRAKPSLRGSAKVCVSALS